MLNMNSPTVQAMLNNLPQGVGNMPVYYGNTPNITSQTIPQQNSTPYPSPKEMVIQAGQNNIYAPTSFDSRNIVGGYNPGYQTAFADYSNPYMGYGTYGGFYNLQLDEDARARLETANFNRISYDEQLIGESKLFKSISRIVSKNIGRDEQLASECESTFDIYNKYPQPEQVNKKPIKPIHIKLKIGDTVVADVKPANCNIREKYYTRNSGFIEEMKFREAHRKYETLRRQNQLYDSALERQFDNMDMLTFFNNAGMLITDSLNRELQQQLTVNSSQMYDKQAFRKRLLENNGLRSRSEKDAVERYVGRYGIMPDGRPVSPGHDPAVASSFSYDPRTGQYSVTAPNFIRDRMERARESFIRSIDES